MQFQSMQANWSFPISILNFIILSYGRLKCLLHFQYVSRCDILCGFGVVAGSHIPRGLSCASIVLYVIQRRCPYTSHGVAYASNTGRTFYVTALWHMRDYGELPLQFSGLLCQRHCCGKHCQSVYIEKLPHSSLGVAINSDTGRTFYVTALWHMRNYGELSLNSLVPYCQFKHCCQ